jgi:hypothetical protein
MRNEHVVKTETHKISVGTSERDGYMYLAIMGDDGSYKLKLTEENRDALRTVLGSNENWKGVL